MKDMRETGRGTRRGSRSGTRALVAVGATLLLLLVPVLIAGCGDGGGGTTTTAVTGGGGPTTTTTAGTSTGSSDTVATSVSATTTTTTGISISLPTTTSSEITTTTVSLSSAETMLPSGHIKAMGFIDKVYIQDGKRYISIDYAEMLTGPAALAAAIAAGDVPPGGTLDTDYYIANTNPQKRIFEVSNSVAITTSTRWVAGDDMGAPCTWTAFKSFWGPAGALAESEKHLHDMPWWIERDALVVIKIDEQYLP
jgi:hypothetical protein